MTTVDAQARAGEALDAGDLDLAERLYLASLTQSAKAKLGAQTSAATAHWGLYHVYYRRDSWEVALNRCRLAAEEASGSDYAICSEIRRAAPLAELDLLFLMGKWTQVEQRAGVLLRSCDEDDNGELFQYRGRALMRLRRPADALLDLERALAVIDPRDGGLALLLRDLGLAQIQAGLGEGAAETFEILARYPDEAIETRHLTGRAAALALAERARKSIRA